MLLEAGRLLSTAGSSLTAIAYPLLVLALTHSPADAGLVTFARLAPYGIFALPAGIASDRWNRRHVMIVSDAVRATAIGALAALILAGDVELWRVVVVAFVEGAGATFFSAAEPGALRAVVPAVQLPTAVGAREARGSVVRLGGPPLGGALFTLGHSVPFVADAVSYLFSTTSLLLMRAPFQQTRKREATPLRAQIAEGFHFLWKQPFLRTTALLYGVGNFLVPAMLLVVVVVGRRQGLSGGEIGLLTASVGVGTLIGSLASPIVRKTFSARTILLLELWAWLFSWMFVIWPNVVAIAAFLVLFGIAAPVTDSVVVGYRLAMTPDRLVGRVESVRSNISLLVAPLGPLAAGLLLEATTERATVALLATIGLALAIWGTLSSAIRDAPSVRELAAQ